MILEYAIQKAIETVKELFGGTDHRLEEVEFTGDEEYEITVSYRSPDSPRLWNLGSESPYTAFQGKRAAIGVDPGRTYKDVVIKKDGQVKAVRMRQIVVG